MVLTTNRKGQLAVSKAEMRAFELGFIPSRPLYDSRYDLIIDTGANLLRAQVKYANGRPSRNSGAVIVKLEYISRVKNLFTYKQTEVDVLIVYIPIIDKLCFIPNNVFLGKRKINIRISPPKNNQKSRVIAAGDYYW